MPFISTNNEIALILLIIFVFTIIAVIITRIFLSQKTRPLMLQYEGVVAPYFGLPAVLIKNESYSLLKFQFCQVSRQNN